MDGNSLGTLGQWLLAMIVPVALHLTIALRSSRGRQIRLPIVATLALGAIAYLPVELVRHWLFQIADIEPNSSQDSIALLLCSFLVIAPLKQAAKVAAVIPVFHSRHFGVAFDGVLYPSAAAVGFASAHAGWILWDAPLLTLDLLRAALSVAGQVSFALLWGYAMGREKQRRLTSRLFNGAFMVAVFFGGLFDHIVFLQGPNALIASFPLLVPVALVAWIGARDLYARSRRRTTRTTRTSRFLRAVQPPSLRAMREALKRTERPVMLTWIAFGALVTTGVITACLAGAVFMGHRLGVDFAAVDRSTAAANSTPPLVLLGSAALVAFPIAGFLVARASSTKTVLEPALSAALAIVGALVMLGFAAPIAVLFAMACAPVAFGLACAGAWVGLAR